MKHNFKFTIFTPCYNGEHTISRVFQSMEAQTYTNFEWIIINDGSKDNSDIVIKGLIEVSPIKEKIVYLSQHNQGKHIILNQAVDMAESDWFYIADCDDTIKPYTLEFFNDKAILLIEDSPYNYAIGGGKNCQYLKDSAFVAICANCYNPETDEVIGDPFPDGLISDYIEEKIKLKLRGEHMGINRTDVLKQYKMPEVKGHFYTEARLWMALAVDGYKQLYFNENLRAYYYTEGSLTNSSLASRLDPNRVYMYLCFTIWEICHAGKKIYKASPIAYFKLYIKCFKRIVELIVSMFNQLCIKQKF